MLKSYFILQSYVTRLLNRDDRGATAVEYGLLVTVIALVMVIGATFLGTQLRDLFNNVGTAL